MYSDSSTLRTHSNTRIGCQGSSAVNDSVLKVPRFSSPRGMNSDARKGQITFARFIETRFIPDHVTHKSRAGQTHYYSILKHAVRPETVTCLCENLRKNASPRLHSSRGWPYLDDVRLCDITPGHVLAIVTAAVERGYSTQTVKHIRNVIGAVISFALQEGILAGKNCAWQVELPAMTRGRTQSLSAGEVRSILAMMKSPERETALIMIATGMNISEICGLLWSHVNLGDAAVRCESTDIPPRTLLVERQWNGHGLIDVQPNRVRLVDIPDGLFPLLFRWQCELTEPLHDAFVVPSSSGEPVSPINTRDRVLKPIGRKINMPWLSWQALKRSRQSVMNEVRCRLVDELVLSVGHFRN